MTEAFSGDLQFLFLSILSIELSYLVHPLSERWKSRCFLVFPQHHLQLGCLFLPFRRFALFDLRADSQSLLLHLRREKSLC